MKDKNNKVGEMNGKRKQPRDQWRKGEDMIGGYRTIRPVPGELDDCSLYGEYGFIFRYNTKGEYRTVVHSSRVANRICEELGNAERYDNREDEALIEFFEKDLNYVIRKIRAYRTLNPQIREARNWGRITFRDITKNSATFTNI